MQRNFLFAITLLLISAMLIAGCGGEPAQAQTSYPTNPPVPTAEGLTEETITQTPVAASHGGPVTDYVSLIDNLRAEGATVESVGEIEQAFFSVAGQSINVNGANVQVFEYADATATGADAALVAPDGGSIGTTMVTWVAAPHFYKTGMIIVLYVGTDTAITDLLEKVIGPQFAGG